ncbi:MAG: response regulator [Candidatus Delongbacteria bacterium]|nr:response regulator [Candidatus Delongbacteria bacterium]
MSSKILIIDDNKMVLESLKEILEDEGFIVYTVLDEKDALKIIIHQSPELALVDMTLSDSTGEDFIIKAHKTNQKIKYCIYTGDQTYSPTQQMKNCGVSENNVFFKPICDFNLFITRINQIIEEN